MVHADGGFATRGADASSGEEWNDGVGKMALADSSGQFRKCRGPVSRPKDPVAPTLSE